MVASTIRIIFSLLKGIVKERINPFTFIYHLSLLKKHNLFSFNFYTTRYHDVPRARLHAAGHFLIFGSKEKRDPIALFSTEHYLEQTSLPHHIPAIIHYLKQPSKTTLTPHPVFKNFDSKIKFDIPLKDFYFDFIKGNYPTTTTITPYFDPEYYLSKYPDIAQGHGDPLVHYLTYGWYEGRECHPIHSFTEYLKLNNDLAKARINPFYHFIDRGEREGRVLPSHPTKRDVVPYLPVPSFERSSVLFPHPVDVVVPVYEGYEETMSCLRSLKDSHNETPWRVIVINDCSPNATLVSAIEEFCKMDERFTYYKNEVNLGFIKTVNKGMTLSESNDVVLLNSDTQVPQDGWLDKIAYHAYSAPEVAAVSPFSNNATLCNFPTLKGMPDAAPEEVLKLQSLLTKSNDRRSVQIPTAHGFCVYLRRDAIAAIGTFDAETFGKGYGEENDWAQRARATGRTILLAADVIVYHVGEASFSTISESRAQVIAQSEEILQERYPSFKKDIAKFYSLDPVTPCRVAAGITYLDQDPRPKLLLITHNLGGGIDRYLNDAAQTLSKEYCVLIARPPVKIGATDDIAITLYENPEWFELKANATHNVEFFITILKALNIQRIDIHSTVLVSNAVRSIVLGSKIPFRFFAHDYYTICPQVNLVTKFATYCGEPCEADCNHCIAERRNYQSTDIVTWRINQNWLLTQAAEVICPSMDVAKRLHHYWPSGNYTVVPHEKDLYRAEAHAVKTVGLKAGEKIRVAILGVLAAHKGALLVKDLLDKINAERLPIEIHLVGYPEDAYQDLKSKGLNSTGRYKDSQLQALIEKTNPHLLFFPAQWPETYSYTLSAGLLSGRPIVAPDIGAFTERLKDRAQTFLYNVPTTAQELISLFNTIVGRATDIPSIPPSYNNNKRVVTFSKEPISKIRVGIVPEMHSTVYSPCAYIRLLYPLFHKTLSKDITPIVIRPEEIATAPVDVIATQRTICKNTDDAEKFLEAAVTRNLPVIYDLDDNLLDIDPHHDEYEILNKLSGAVKLFVKESDQVWVSTPPLLKNTSARGAKSTALFLNALDEELWGLQTRVIYPRAHHPVQVCYMGTATHRPDFSLITPVLKALKEKYHAHLIINLIGVLASHTDNDWYSVINKPLGEGQTYPSFVRWYYRLPPMDIGIAPLVDNEFNSYKSGIKFMDYAAIGMTTVASDVEAYKHTVKHQQSGLLVANTEQAWFDALDRLISDKALLLSLRTNAVEQLQSQHLLSNLGAARADNIKIVVNRTTPSVANT